MEAYYFAEDTSSPQPQELRELAYIDRFGVEAVIGRTTLSAGEIYRMIFAENVVTAFNSRKQSKNWADWAEKYQSQDALLKRIETGMINASSS